MNVPQPVLVSVLVFCGIELQFVVHDRRQGDVGKVLHLQEPLQREARLDGGVGVALGIAYFVHIVLYVLHQSGRFKVFGNLLAAGKAFHAHIQGRLLADSTIGIEDVDGLQIVRLAQHVVVGVVGRSHLQASCSEFDVDISVFYDGNLAPYKRYDDALTLEPLVFRVFRVDAHGGIAHDGLRTRGGHYRIVSFVAFFVFVKSDDTTVWECDFS